MKQLAETGKADDNGTKNACVVSLTSVEQKLLERVRGFRESKLHPRWSAPVAEAWDEFLVRLVRRFSDSGLFYRGIER